MEYMPKMEYQQRMQYLPRISVCVSTYGRWWLLEEMMQSFLSQDYAGQLEMVIVNDATGVELVTDLPNVRIVNLQATTPNPVKRDLAVSMATGELATFYDDDDLMMPYRFSSQIQWFRKYEDLDYLKCHVAYWMNYERIEEAYNFYFCSHLWRRDKYTTCQSQDRSMYDDTVAAMNLGINCNRIHIVGKDCYHDDDIVHIYRWAGTGVHHSGISINAGEAEPTFQDRCRKDWHWKTGRIELHPHFKNDYYSMVADFRKGKYTERKESLRNDQYETKG